MKESRIGRALAVLLGSGAGAAARAEHARFWDGAAIFRWIDKSLKSQTGDITAVYTSNFCYDLEHGHGVVEVMRPEYLEQALLKAYYRVHERLLDAETCLSGVQAGLTAA